MLWCQEPVHRVPGASLPLPTVLLWHYSFPPARERAREEPGTLQASLDDGDGTSAVMVHVGVSFPQALLCWPQRMGWPCPYIS